MNPAEKPQQNNVPEDDYEPDLITLEDEKGEEYTFEVLDKIVVGEKEYLALVPYFDDEEADEDAEMIIMRLNVKDGEECLDIIDDEDELQDAAEAFRKRLSEIYKIDLDALGI